MWLLGAGASRQAGIPTAYDIIWELKCRTYCLQQQRDFSNFSDYTSPVIRAEVQSFLNGNDQFKNVNPDDEYSFFLEYVFKDNPEGLRKYIQEKVKNDKVYPSYGHKFLGLLLKYKLCNVIWTTNFDTLIEDSYSAVGGAPSDLNVAELSGAVLAKRALNDRAFPLYVKLHGDFRYENIRNLKEDLQRNTEFSEALEIACNQNGLAVSGYSGRDKSAMRYLDSALEKDNPFPKGLYWFIRPGQPAFQAVKDLIEKAQRQGVDAKIIEIDNFNELMSRIKKQFTKIPTEDTKAYLDSRYDIPNIPIPTHGTNYPIIKTNAIPVTRMPQRCYALKNSKISDFTSLIEGMREAKEFFPAALRNDAVLSFNAKIAELFGGELEIFAITDDILNDRNETHIFNLLQRSLFNIVCENKPSRIFYKGSTAHIVVDYKDATNSSLVALSQATQKIHRRNILCGKIKDTQMHWAESIKLKLDRRLSRFWILLKPDIWIYEGDKDRDSYDTEWELAKSFKDGQLKWRRNYQSAMLLSAWQGILFGTGNKSTASEITIAKDSTLDEKVYLMNALASSKRA